MVYVKVLIVSADVVLFLFYYAYFLFFSSKIGLYGVNPMLLSIVVLLAAILVVALFVSLLSFLEIQCLSSLFWAGSQCMVG